MSLAIDLVGIAHRVDLVGATRAGGALDGAGMRSAGREPDGPSASDGASAGERQGESAGTRGVMTWLLTPMGKRPERLCGGGRRGGRRVA